VARNTGVSGRLDPQVARRTINFRFIGETASELRRVTWPTRQEALRLTLMVITVAAAMGLILGVVDLVFSRIMDVLLGT